MATLRYAILALLISGGLFIMGTETYAQDRAGMVKARIQPASRAQYDAQPVNHRARHHYRRPHQSKHYRQYSYPQYHRPYYAPRPQYRHQSRHYYQNHDHYHGYPPPCGHCYYPNRLYIGVPNFSLHLGF